MSNYKNYFQDFIKENPELLHLAGHSHHYWPDITKLAIQEAYQDASKHVDLKWNKIFGEVVPKTQEIIAKIINFDHPEWIAFAPNTHELLCRVLSTFPMKKEIRILTSKHEFHSARRQLQRMAEEDQVTVDWVETSEIESKLKENQYDLIYLSHVFFDSGLVLEQETIKKIIELKNNALFLLDGYHSFCAIPVDIKAFQDDLFYLAGSYKYAQAGEGLCFMTVPKDCPLRPRNTGWFASFETLEEKTDQVAYSPNGNRFNGATRDFTPHYRFNKIWEMYESDQLSIADISEHIKELQNEFIKHLSSSAKAKLICTDVKKLGHFLTFQCQSHQEAKLLYEELLNAQILTDFRDTSLRFGFGMYLDSSDIQKLSHKIQKIPFFQ